MARVLQDNDGNAVRTVNVRPKDLLVGDVKPGFVTIHVGSLAERTVYDEAIITRVFKTEGQPAHMKYRITFKSPRRGVWNANVSAQASIEIKERS